MREEELTTPCYVIDEERLIANLQILRQLRQDTGCKILLAQKAFACYALYPLLRQYLNGTAASGLYEARLGAEEFGGENHVFSPAYRDSDFAQLLRICDHVVFNSFSQLEKYRTLWEHAENVSIGIRVNPEHSTQDGAIYDPCARYSRLGCVKSQFRAQQLDGVEGLHFHTLCEQNADALVETFDAFEEQFGGYLSQMKWLNLGGGHHITRKDYDLDALKGLISRIQQRYGVEVYLEPGEAVALGAGRLDTTVLDVVENGVKILILDTSASCHMPDVLEMPYRPSVLGAGAFGEKPYSYRLASDSCLAGDIIGDYSFDRPAAAGERLSFEDMAIYTMVKNNTFNGMPLPSIVLRHSDGDCEVLREFGYEDFKCRLS